MKLINCEAGSLGIHPNGQIELLGKTQQEQSISPTGLTLKKVLDIKFGKPKKFGNWRVSYQDHGYGTYIWIEYVGKREIEIPKKFVVLRVALLSASRS